jgi:hypothetical protein
MPGIDGLTPPRLTIELVPSTCWFSNVRSEVTAEMWTRIKRMAYRKAHYRCEICNGVGPKWPVECHEKWQYHDQKRIQALTDMLALCPSCHEVKHIGLAESRGRVNEALAHLAKVNEWSLADARYYAEGAFELWAQRSLHVWTLDISMLNKLGVVPQARAS